MLGFNLVSWIQAILTSCSCRYAERLSAELRSPLQFHCSIVLGEEEGGAAGGPGFGWIPERSSWLTMKAREWTRRIVFLLGGEKMRGSDRRREESGHRGIRGNSPLAKTVTPLERGCREDGVRLNSQ